MSNILDLRSNTEKFKEKRNSEILSIYDEQLPSVLENGGSVTKLMQALANKFGMSHQGVRWVLMQNGRPVTTEDARKEAL